VHAASINTYLLDPQNDEILPTSAEQMHAWCAMGHACLPCMPGTFKSGYIADEMCASCALAKFQNSHGQTTCLDCNSVDGDVDELTTLSVGSKSANDCMCALGFGVDE
jgi:hypothetical protein